MALNGSKSIKPVGTKILTIIHIFPSHPPPRVPPPPSLPAVPLPLSSLLLTGGAATSLRLPLPLPHRHHQSLSSSPSCLTGKARRRRGHDSIREWIRRDRGGARDFRRSLPRWIRRRLPTGDWRHRGARGYRVQTQLGLIRHRRRLLRGSAATTAVLRWIRTGGAAYQRADPARGRYGSGSAAATAASAVDQWLPHVDPVAMTASEASGDVFINFFLFR